MGTQLQAHGLAAGQCPEEWNVSHPEVVQKIYQAYFASGSDVIQTNSFGANRMRLQSYGFENRVKEFNRFSAELAISLRAGGKFVAGSVGPLGKPFESLTHSEAKAIFAEQIKTLLEAGVDLIVIETMTDLVEARTALEAVRKLTDLSVIITMTFEKTPTGYQTLKGVTPAEAAKNLSELEVDVIGANCGRGFDEMIEVISMMRQQTDLPLLAQPNAGLPDIVDGRPVYKETPQYFSERIEALIRAGANIIGGCCGTTPEHIAVIRQKVDDHYKDSRLRKQCHPLV
jgi:5-methyltetrahydrofolate--homocysteine methyltransferase